MKAKRQYIENLPSSKRSKVPFPSFNGLNYDNDFNITPNSSNNDLKTILVADTSNLWLDSFTKDFDSIPSSGYLEIPSSGGDSMIHSLEEALTNYVYKAENPVSFNFEAEIPLDIDPSKIPFTMMGNNLFDTFDNNPSITWDTNNAVTFIKDEPKTYHTPDSIELEKEYDTEDELFITPGTHFRVTFNKFGESKTTYLTRSHFDISEASYSSPQLNSEKVLETVHNEFDMIKKAGRKLFVPYKNVSRKEINKDSERITKARHRWMPTSINCIFHQVNSKDLRIPRDCCFGLLNCRPQAKAWRRKLKFC